MKKYLIVLYSLFIVFFSTSAFAITEKKSVVVLPIDEAVKTSSYAMNKQSADMYAADLVNALQNYNDTQVMDVALAEDLLKRTNNYEKYKNMVKQYKTNYILDFDTAQKIANVLGVNYIILVYGGFDPQKSIMKWNWKFRCQWIWASPIVPSMQLDLTTKLVDVGNRHTLLETTSVKDFPVQDFQTPAIEFAENVVPVAKIKKYSQKESKKIAKKIHKIFFPKAKEKVADKDAFVQRYTPDNNTQNDVAPQPATNFIQQNPNSSAQTENLEQPTTDSVTDSRKNNYKQWVLEQN